MPVGWGNRSNMGPGRCDMGPVITGPAMARGYPKRRTDAQGLSSATREAWAVTGDLTAPVEGS